MITISNEVGHLVEIRAVSPITADDVARFREGLRNFVVASPQSMVVCADATALHILPGDLFGDLLELMLLDNYRIQKSAVLLSTTSPSVELQFSRLVGDAGHRERRIFFDVESLESFLEPSLSRAEYARLISFLGPHFDQRVSA